MPIYRVRPNIVLRGGIMAFQVTGMADLEKRALRFGRNTARTILDRALTKWVNSIAWPKEIPDEEGGEPYRLKQWPRITLNTAVGTIKLAVPSFWKKGKPDLRPAEAALGLRKFISPLLLKMCASIGAELPFALSQQELFDLAGARVCAETIRSICLEVGQTAMEEQLQPRIPDSFGKPERISVFIDGGRVNTDQGWKEPRLARIEVVNAVGVVLTFALTRICEAKAFWSLLEPVLHAVGAKACGLLAFIGDGSDWILGEAKSRFPEATLILDFYHAAEHVHEASKEIFGEGVKAMSWAGKYVKMLKRGRIDFILYRLKSSRPRISNLGTAASNALEGLIGYLEPRRDQCKYLAFRRRGFPIGSGKIESFVKQALNLRLKRNGAWWSLPNADRILALRVSKILDRLEPAWTAHVRKLRGNIPAQFENLLSRAQEPSLDEVKYVPRKYKAA